MVINLCLGEYFAKPEDEKFPVGDTVQLYPERLDFGVYLFC